MIRARSVIVFALCWILFLLSACRGSKGVAGNYKNMPDNYCTPPVNFSYADDLRPEKDSLLLVDPLLTKTYSAHDLLLANATGLLPVLRELAVLNQHDSSIESRIHYLELKQKLTDRLLLASTEIQSISAELDCEGERADQLGDYLDDKHDKRVRRLTVLSIVIGAATTVATVAIKDGTGQKIVGITGGLISAVLAGISALHDHKKVPFAHSRNLLRPIWYDPSFSSSSDSLGSYPPFIRYILNDKRFSNSQQTSIAYNTRNRWLVYEFDGKIDARQERLLFGAGGLYTAEDLHRRANMLNQLQSTIRSINQDFQRFMAALRTNTGK